MSEKLTTFNKVHHKVDSEFILEHILHVDKELMLDGVKDLLLKLNILNLFIFNDNVLADALHCIEFIGVTILDKEDLTESTLTKHLTDLEVFQFGIILTTVEHLLTTSCHTLSSLAIKLIKSLVSKVGGVLVGGMLLSSNLNLLFVGYK